MKKAASSQITQPYLFSLTDELYDETKDTGPFAVSYEPIPVRRSTFLSGLSENVHAWFRLTPSFGPDLVRTMIKEMKISSTAHIHDPFSGAATTAIEASLEGHPASCIEINPFLYFVGKTCLDWNLKASDIEKVFSKIEKKYFQLKKSATLETMDKLGVSIPRIHNVHRWWRPDVLLDILILKYAIRESSKGTQKSFFDLSLAAVLVPDLTNVTLGKLQLHFVNKDKISINVWEIYSKHTKSMIEDLISLNKSKIISQAKIFFGDSTKEETFKDIPKIDAIITSPPYPNRYSYIWNTRPHLYMLDMITEAKEASQIDRQTIGGTWGTATSELGKGVFLPICDIVNNALNGVHERIAKTDQLMANYVTHYFNRMYLHLISAKTRLNPKAQLAYVVGNSWIKGEYVATDVILAKIIDAIWETQSVTKLHRFRKRNSGKNIYETVVYASLP